jgi:general secretion pathway protein K
VLDDGSAGDVQSAELCRVPTRNAGFIIIAVLWILGALATLAVIYSIYVRETAIQFVGHDERLQAQGLATAGVELAAYQLTADPRTRPLQGQFSFRQGTATISVTFRSEDSRIDLNFAPKELLAGLFAGLGVQTETALGYADRIIGYRTPLQSGGSDPETGFYQAGGQSYGPRHGPFQHSDELAMVATLPAALLDRILPYVTVYSGRPEVNVLIAPPQVLAAVPGVTATLLQQLLAVRVTAPQDIASAGLGVAAQYLTLDPAKACRVDVDVQFQSGRQMRSEAVILLSDSGTAPYQVLSWQDDEASIDQSAAAGMR